MKKIKDMYMWELEDMVDAINRDRHYTMSKLYIDKPHHELCFDCDIFDDVEYDIYWNFDSCELTESDLIDYINDYFEELNKA